MWTEKKEEEEKCRNLYHNSYWFKSIIRYGISDDPAIVMDLLTRFRSLYIDNDKFVYGATTSSSWHFGSNILL